MNKEDYVKTIIVNNKMVNIGIDDYGQTFYLEYEQNGQLVEDCVGCYETDYVGYAEMLFEDPRHCDHFENVGTTCEICDKTYCGRCPLSWLVQARDKRLKEAENKKNANATK